MTGVALAVLEGHVKGLVFSSITSRVMALGTQAGISVGDGKGIIGAAWRIVAFVTGHTQCEVAAGFEQFGEI